MDTQMEESLHKFKNIGIQVSMIDQQLSTQKTNNIKIHHLIAECVKLAESRNELEKEVFYVIAMAYFGRTFQRTYIPAELAVVKYSLLHGVMDRMHMHINPGEIPLGAAYSTEIHTGSTHKLPIPPNALGYKDVDEIAQKLLSFFARHSVKGKIPMLFTDDDTVPIVESMLRDMLTADNEDTELCVYPLSKLFCELKKAAERYFMYKLTKTSDVDVQLLLKELKDCFASAKGISCDFHEKECNVVHCALSQATRWVYTISKHCCFDMGIICVPGKHIPESTKSSMRELATSKGELCVKASTSGIVSSSKKQNKHSGLPNRTFKYIMSENEAKQHTSSAIVTKTKSVMYFDQCTDSKSSNSKKIESSRNATSTCVTSLLVSKANVPITRTLMGLSKEEKIEGYKHLMQMLNDMQRRVTAKDTPAVTPAECGLSLLAKQEIFDDSCTGAKSATEKPEKGIFNETQILSISNDEPHTGDVAPTTENSPAASVLTDQGNLAENHDNTIAADMEPNYRGNYLYQRGRHSRRGYYTQRRGFKP